MKKYFLIAMVFIAFTACTKQTVIDTGVAKGNFSGNMMEYLRSDTYNWELTVKLIERAGLTDLFEGKVDSLKEITFLGFKTYTVLRFLYDSQFKDSSQGKYYTVDDIPVDRARGLVLRYVIGGKHLKETIAYKDKQYLINDPKQTGGTRFTTVQGNQVMLYLETSPYGGVPDAGPVSLKVYSITKTLAIPMATPDLQSTNGVVHAFSDGIELGII